jgi:hypothetical protein
MRLGFGKGLLGATMGYKRKISEAEFFCRKRAGTRGFLRWLPGSGVCDLVSRRRREGTKPGSRAKAPALRRNWPKRAGGVLEAVVTKYFTVIQQFCRFVRKATSISKMGFSTRDGRGVR